MLVSSDDHDDEDGTYIVKLTSYAVWINGRAPWTTIVKKGLPATVSSANLEGYGLQMQEMGHSINKCVSKFLRSSAAA
jgi:hypothetical protein